MPTKKKNSLGEKIRDGRSVAGLSQKELAEKLGVSQPQVSLWESGKLQPDAERTERLEEMLGGITEDQADADQALPPVATWLARTLSKRNLTVHELNP